MAAWPKDEFHSGFCERPHTRLIENMTLELSFVWADAREVTKEEQNMKKAKEEQR